jgi:hypothetical protein
MFNVSSWQLSSFSLSFSCLADLSTYCGVSAQSKNNVATERAVAMERLGRHVSAEMNSRNNRTAVFSEQPVPRGYKKNKERRLSQLSFETPSCQDMSLGAEEFN